MDGNIMTLLKFIPAFSLAGFCYCGQPSVKHKVDPAVVELNNKAMTLVQFISNPDSSTKAIALLDKATSIDSTYFLGYYNKLMFYYQLKQFDKAILTVNKLIQLRPAAHDLYMVDGFLYEKTGDTVSAKRNFEKSLAICNTVLDTMSSGNRDYDMLETNRAVNLVMLGDTTKANEILQKLYNNQSDAELKKITRSLMHKSKKELLDQFINRTN